MKNVFNGYMYTLAKMTQNIFAYLLFQSILSIFFSGGAGGVDLPPPPKKAMFIYVLPEGSCKKVIIFIFLPFRNKIYFSTYIDIWTYHVKVCWSVLVCYNNICQKIGVYFSPKIGGRKILKIRSF